MFANRFGIAALAVACVTAAGVGGYVASRQNAVTPAPVSAAAVTPAPAAQTVQETEAVVGDTSRPADAPPAEAPQLQAKHDVPAAKPQPTSKTARGSEASSKTVARNNGQAPTLDRSWPSSASTPSSETTSGAPASAPAAQDEPRAIETPSAPEPPARNFEELVIASNSVVGLQMTTAISSEQAKVEDRVEAKVVRDVRAGGRVAVPAGSRAIGSVMAVDKGGKFKERARLGIRFHTLVLADGTELPISTETVYRYGDAPGNSSAAKVGGGAVAGAILGAILGGGKGAAIGTAAGAGAGTAVVMAGDANAATFPAGTEVTARIVSPVTVTVEK